jgi:Tfp pilus assembly protein PilV
VKRGFTLLEILIALILFTAGVVAIAGALSGALIGSADAENTTVAMNLAKARMEEIRNLGFAAIVNEPRGDIDIDRDGVSDFPGFQRETIVTTAETDLTEVEVAVYWTVKGDEVSLSLATYISAN